VVSLRERPSHRSFLYAPGSNAHILAKVLTAGADAVILDLEDAVAAADKDSARETVAALVRDEAPAASCAVHVRVNRDRSGYSEIDIAAVVHRGLAALRLPKCDDAAEVGALDQLLSTLETERGLREGEVLLYPTIETAAGALRAGEIARSSPRVAALAFGPSDFAADLGLPRLDSFEATAMARSMLVMESRAAGIGRPVDGAFTSLGDVDGLRRAARRARELGFAGKSAIHPAQLPVLHDVVTPTPEELVRARKVVASLDESTAAAVVDGGFVDPAVVAHARRLIEMAERAGAREVED
jgi:citrate lyase subunit beta/citryl-CoA lyase